MGTALAMGSTPTVADAAVMDMATGIAAKR